MYKVISTIFFITSGIMIFIGFDKMFNYSSNTYALHNAYVGGDAYNYIINGNYATAFFVLATLFVILGIGTIIIHYISEQPKTEIVNHEQ